MSGTPLTDAINALTTYANEITGQSDTTLSDAVESLVDGYGGGGGYTAEEILAGEAPSGVVIFTASSDIKARQISGRKNLTGLTILIPSRIVLSTYAITDNSGMETLTINGTDYVINGYTITLNSGIKTLTLIDYANEIPTNAFRQNSNMITADLGNATSLGSNSLYGCSNLKNVILRGTSVCTLSATSAFLSTPLASSGTGGTLYVPQSLISSYQSANNWSTILGYENNSIVAIEGSQYETQYADGTPISTT